MRHLAILLIAFLMLISLCAAENYYTIIFVVENHQPGYTYSVFVTDKAGNQTWSLFTPSPEFSMVLPRGEYLVTITTPIALNVTEQTLGDFTVYYSSVAAAQFEMEVDHSKNVTVTVKGGPDYPHKSVDISVQIDTSTLEAKLNSAISNFSSWVSSQEVSSWLDDLGISSLSVQLAQNYVIKVYLSLKDGSSYTYTLKPYLRLAMYSDICSATAKKSWTGSTTVDFQGSLPNASTTVEVTLLWEFTTPVNPLPLTYTSPPPREAPSVFLAFTESKLLALNESSLSLTLGADYYPYAPSINITGPEAVTILTILSPAFYPPPANITAPPMNITIPSNVTGAANVTPSVVSQPPPTPSLQQMLTNPVYLASLVLFVVFIVVVAALMTRKP
ncbi:MAG: hypothetical protein J7L98_07705 [Candidatus Verstraetearchaeota archaeon]|nr:hypothetical protein [Candidatus Verstraetearchaeota archaeon]